MNAANGTESARVWVCLLGVALALGCSRDQGTPAPARRVAATGKLKVMAFGAHPDDVEIGCGGTLAKYARQGHDVVVVFLTKGGKGMPRASQEEARATRRR